MPSLQQAQQQQQEETMTASEGEEKQQLNYYYNNKAHSSVVCDRRLSRAAREMLQRHLVPVLLHHQNNNEMSDKANDDDDASSLAPTILYKALNDSIPAAKRDTCVLNPQLDLYRYHEEQSLQVPTSPAFRLPYKKMNHAYQCGICGKTFMSRYYLDLHLNNHHHHSNDMGEENNNKNYICPADAWCNILGGKGACQLEALEMEPYYGRGSGGYGMDARKVRHEHYRQAHSWRCTQEQMETSREKCHQTVSDCFSNQVARDVKHALCDGLTCNDVLHNLLGIARRHVHTWKEEWNLHQSHRVGIGGCILVLVLMCFYSYKGIQRLSNKRRRYSKRGPLYSSGNMLSIKKRLEGRTHNKSKLQ